MDCNDSNSLTPNLGSKLNEMAESYSVEASNLSSNSKKKKKLEQLKYSILPLLSTQYQLVFLSAE